jgi:hypothetical protein
MQEGHGTAEVLYRGFIQVCEYPQWDTRLEDVAAVWLALLLVRSREHGVPDFKARPQRMDKKVKTAWTEAMSGPQGE